MGEIAEMHLDGTLCERCGEFLNEDPPGYPCYCAECSLDKNGEVNGLVKDIDKKKKKKGEKDD